MLACLHHAPARGVSWPIGRLADAQGAVRATRTKTTKTDAVTKLTTPIAEKLHKAKIWHPSKRATKGSLKREGFNLKPTEGRRVNIVSEKLCGEYLQGWTKALRMEADTCCSR